MILKSSQFILCLLVVLIVSFVRPFLLFSMHFVFDPGGINSCLDCYSKTEDTTILPLTIHQVYYNISQSDISFELKDAQHSWTLLNKEFKYILWNETMVEQLLSEKYPELEDLYYSYNRWIHKVDLARYVILHQYGGVYSDIDIECKRNMLAVYMTLPVNTGIVMYYTSPFGVSNDFIIAKAKHPFMTAVIRGLSSSYRWYVLPFLTEMFSTGPMYLSARFWSFKNRYDMIVLKDTRSFLVHKTGTSWHEADSKILWWIFLNIRIVIQWMIIVIGAVVLVCVACRFLRSFKGNMKINTRVPYIRRFSKLWKK